MSRVPSGSPGAWSRSRSRSLSSSSSSIADGPRVKLEVGGAVFLTHACTVLSREPKSLLARDVAAAVEAVRASNNNGGGEPASLSPPSSPVSPTIRLEYARSARHFLFLMTYLRTGAVDTARLDDADLGELVQEAGYFQLAVLRDRLTSEVQRRKDAKARRLSAPRTGPKGSNNNSNKEEEESLDMFADLSLRVDRMPVPDHGLMFDLVL